MKEFDLSQHIVDDSRSLHVDYIHKGWVQEFIKKREIVIQSFLKEEISCAMMWIELNKLAGDLNGVQTN